jgi:poly-gamma-glutamate synthesis protein (capsule biosynthesis protein)
MAEELHWMGFNLFARANNHTMDYGDGGLLATSRVLDSLGLVHAGAGCNLGEARGPAYLDTKSGRVALISMSSSFASFGRAGHARPDMKGRPGLNPLRYETKLVVRRETMAELKRMFDDFGIKPKEEKGGVISFMNLKFATGKPAIVTSPNETDVKEIAKSIKDAKRQADHVLISLHAHEPKGADREVPSDFIPTFCRRCIDEGADAIIGHGPHLLRGIEIYKKKPIMYSLGNFIFQNETIRFLPSEIYERQGLTADATPADVYDARYKGGKPDERGYKWFTYDPLYWEAVVARFTLGDNRASDFELYPIMLGMDQPRSQRGRPVLANGKHAKTILTRLQKLSAPFKTRIRIEGSIGKIRI